MHRVDMHALEKGRDLSRGDDVITMTPCGGKTGMEEGTPSPPLPLACESVFSCVADPSMSMASNTDAGMRECGCSAKRQSAAERGYGGNRQQLRAGCARNSTFDIDVCAD